MVSPAASSEMKRVISKKKKINHGKYSNNSIFPKSRNLDEDT